MIGLSPADVAAVDEVLDTALRSAGGPAQESFWLDGPVLAQELPRSLRAAFTHFRLREREPVLLVRGYPVDDALLGPTPGHWRHARAGEYRTRLDTLFCLLSCLLGDAIAWEAQQEGAIVHDVLPIRGDEWRQISSTSRAEVTLHTEDAFDPHRGDYVGLLCLRNPDAVPTTYACIDDVALDPEVRDVLFEPRFLFRPDEAQDADLVRPGEALLTSVLFGARTSPYVRVDPYFMDSTPDDPVATACLETLVGGLQDGAQAVALEPGDVMFVDNFRAVHGRRGFVARYEGNDRWLRRINVARDLRRSRGARPSATARVIGATAGASVSHEASV